LSSQPTANQLLDRPADARLLIVNADDFGMCHAANEAVSRAFADGLVTSTTVMAPCPWAEDAFRRLKARPDLPFGVHLTLVSEFPGYRWGPLASKRDVPSLVDERGKFVIYDRIPELAARAELAQVEREFRAQIEAVLAEELAPTHLDFHCLADGGRPDIFDLSVRLARKHGLALRVHGRDAAERLQGEGLPALDHPVLDSYQLGWENKADRFAELLRALPPGLSEWAVHPSLGDAEAQAIEPETWRIRRADFDFVTSPEARRIIAEEGIELLDYRALQAIWSA
jgi:predicted glycoside hydrolase/deacetylase ChbG (UPF0249 family)